MTLLLLSAPPIYEVSQGFINKEQNVKLSLVKDNG